MNDNSQTTTEKTTDEQPIDTGLSPEQENALNMMQPDYEPKAEGEKADRQSAKQKQQVQMVGLVVAGVFEVLSSRLGDHWRLDPKEVKAIAEPASMVIDKYLPDFESGPEFALLAAVGMVVVPRVLVQKQISQEQPEGAEHGDQPKSVA